MLKSDKFHGPIEKYYLSYVEIKLYRISTKLLSLKLKCCRLNLSNHCFCDNLSRIFRLRDGHNFFGSD